METDERLFVWCSTPPDKKMNRVTKGEDYAVTGGSKEDHDQLVEFTSVFAKRIRENPPDSMEEFDATAKDTMKCVFGKSEVRRIKRS